MIHRRKLFGATMLVTLLALTAIMALVTLAGEPTADFGDAPDATNSTDAGMTAYDQVPARFPTAFQRAAPPYGPRHENNPAVFILGTAYSGEEAADSGADSDFDGINNLQPGANFADYDGFDDGMAVPESFAHCEPVTLTYAVTVLSTYGGPIYANLWADWNHNGAWDGPAPEACPAGDTAAEWVLRNEPLNINAPGTYTFSVSFTPWYPDSHDATWLRLSVSEQMAGSDGSGPVDGYLYGETEDYEVPGTVSLLFLPIQSGSGAPPPPPPDPDTHVDTDEPPPVLVTWGQLPPDDNSALIPDDELILRLENQGDVGGEATVDLTVIYNGRKEYRRFGPLQFEPGPYSTDLTLTGHMTDVIGLRSPGIILAEVHVVREFSQNDASGERFDISPLEPINFHTSASAPDLLVIYNEAGYRRQIQARAFDHDPDLWGRLALGFPGEIHPGLAQIVSYVHGDPVLMEPEPDEGHLDGVGGDGVDQLDNSGGAFTLCLEWFTAPVDNNMGEDYGRNDDGWRARGALVRVYYSGAEVFDGYLNSAGCALINMNASNGGLAHIEFDGQAALQGGSGYNYLRRTWAWDDEDEDDEPVDWTAAIQINGVQSGSTYRPEIPNNDAFSVLSYAAQERFNGGENGNILYLIKANCRLEINDSCSTIYDGVHAIFVKNSQWNRKFLVGHEWGHKILSLAASYTNDCSLNGSGHGMSSWEYASCAAMEGWAHYVSTDVWNSHAGSSNPGATFVYWNGYVFDVELQYNSCYNAFGPLFLFVCDIWGVEKDWMRFWWDFHTNSTPGTAPHHAQLFDIIDDVSWQSGNFAASEAFLDVLAGTLNTRWGNYACWNGIGFDHCP